MYCDSYTTLYGGEPRCNGTKEVERCYCSGDTDFCSFYPEKRKPKKLNTAEMWLKAQEDGKQYRAKDVLYSKATGLVAADDFEYPWSVSAWASFNTGKDAVRHEIDELMNEQWEEVKIPTMTKAEAEAKLGVKIVD